MSEAVDRGITVTEIAPMDQPIDVCPETTAAFVGRALRGPLNTPVLVENFGAFRRRFGDVWTRSSLGPAVQQFFEHGGKRLYIVRIANNARGAMLCLPASGSALVLRALDPGSTEYVRAAVDYDGIDDDQTDLFNLTLQRVDPKTGVIIDQEFFRKCALREEAADFVADLLVTSTLARVEHPFPTHRPERTLATGASYASTYVAQSQAGTDGSEPSNYDLIGARNDESGLFALEQLEHFDLLYIPPLGKGVDAGPAAILAAELYCRERRAMLIVDPLREWDTAQEAARGMRDLGYASPNMLGYFPRVKVRGKDNEIRAIGGALAGLLCKLDRTFGPWQTLAQPGIELHRWLSPAVDVNSDDQSALNRVGLNLIATGCGGRSQLNGSVTMSRGSEADRKFSRLPVRRFCLQIVNTIARATRWAVFETINDNLTQRIRGQILTYLDCLNDLGAFANESFVVECDAGVSSPHDNGISILLEFQPVGCAEPLSLTLHQTASGCRIGSTTFARPAGG